jgi:hypothetical protein
MVIVDNLGRVKLETLEGVFMAILIEVDVQLFEIHRNQTDERPCLGSEDQWCNRPNPQTFGLWTHNLDNNMPIQ